MTTLTCALISGMLYVTAPSQDPVLIQPENSFVRIDAAHIEITPKNKPAFVVDVPSEWQDLLLPDILNRCVIKAAGDSF